MKPETKMCECGEPTQRPSGLCGMCDSDSGLFTSPPKIKEQTMNKTNEEILIDLLSDLLGVTELNMDDVEPETSDIVHRASVFLADTYNR